MLRAVLDKTPIVSPTITYDIYSGDLRVGRIQQHNTGGGNSGTWGYSFSFANHWPQGSMAPAGGGFATMEDAMKAMRTEFEKWCSWAGLQEISDPASRE